MGIESFGTALPPQEDGNKQETTKENLDDYFERVKKALIEKTLAIINQAPDNSKAEALDRALTFFGSLDRLVNTLDTPNIDVEAVQESISRLAEKAGLDPEIISVSEYQKLMKETN
jgi:hypothetical protein